MRSIVLSWSLVKLPYYFNVVVIDSLKPKTEGLMQNQDLAGRGKKNENHIYREIEETQPD
jgi:hypothetical protein